jgi:uncharacterized protein YukE
MGFEIPNIPGAESVTNEIKKWSSVNTTQFSDVRDGLQRAATKAEQSHSGVSRTLQSLSAAWRGKDADSYKGYMDGFLAASKAAHQLLNDGVKSIDKAVKDLDSAKGEMEAALNRLRTTADQKLKTITADNGDKPVTQAQHIQAGQQAAAEVKPNVDNAVQAAQKAMQEMSTALSQQSTQMASKTYNTVPAAGGGGGGAMNSNSVAYNNGGGSGGGGGAGGLGSSGAPPNLPPPSGNVKQWIDQAIAELEKNGVKLSDSDKAIIAQMIQKESGGDPHAINNWDSNAQKGTPSKGLMQCIDPTFQAHKLPGHNDIYNPVDNICAGVRYSLDRYGSMANVPGVKAMASGGGYVGY